MRGGVKALFAVLLSLVWLSCNSRVGEDPPPLPPTSKKVPAKVDTTAASTSENSASSQPAPTPTTPASKRRPPPQSPKQRVRFAIKAPALAAIDPSTLGRLTATVQLDQESPQPVTVQDRRTARQGMAVLLVLPMPQRRVGWKEAVRELVDRVGPWDTVAVGVIDRSGFRLIQSFSADPLGIISAISSLPEADDEEQVETLLRNIPVHRGILEALDAFQKGQLPELRSMVLLGDGRDRTVRRSSARDRIEQFIRKRAQALGVRISLLSTVASDESGDVRRMQQLAESSGGVAYLTDGSGEQLSTGFAQLGEGFQRWLITEFTQPQFPPKPTEVTLTIGFPKQSARCSASSAVSHKTSPRHQSV